MNVKQLATGLSLLAGLTCTPAVALDAFKIDGIAFLDEEACATGVETEGCELTFSITGKAAKVLYEGMKAQAQKEECTGRMQKVEESGLNCIKNSKTEFTCDFGYHFKERAFGGSGMDC